MSKINCESSVATKSEGVASGGGWFHLTRILLRMTVRVVCSFRVTKMDLTASVLPAPLIVQHEYVQPRLPFRDRP